MDRAAQCSSNVFLNGASAFLHGLSFVDTVRGDEADTRDGVVSRVHGRVSHSLQHRGSVFVNGRPIVRTGDRVYMNTRKP